MDLNFQYPQFPQLYLTPFLILDFYDGESEFPVDLLIPVFLPFSLEIHLEPPTIPNSVSVKRQVHCLNKNRIPIIVGHCTLPQLQRFLAFGGDYDHRLLSFLLQLSLGYSPDDSRSNP